MATQLSTASPRSRRPQARSAETRRALLDATIACLHDYGYSGLTTSRVAVRAGVSRGAQQHHFPTREALVVAAVDHLIDQRIADLRAQAQALPSQSDRVLVGMRLLTNEFSGPTFEAGLELWVAARTDEGLRRQLLPLDRKFVELGVDLCRTLVGPEVVAHPRVNEAMELVVDALRGAAVGRVLQPEAIGRRFDHLVPLLANVVEGMLAVKP